MTLKDFFHDFYEPLKMRSCSPRSSVLHLTAIRSLEICLGRAALLSDLTDMQVNRYLRWFRGLGRSPYSVQKNRDCLLALWRFAFHKKLINEWPEVPNEVCPQNTPTAWTTDEIQRILTACSEVEGRFERIPAAVFWTCVVLVVWDTGERIGAVRALQWSDLDLKGGWLDFRAESRKGGWQSKTHRLSQTTVDALKMLKLDARRDQVFYFPFAETHFFYKFNAVLKIAGLHSVGHKFHKIRRSVASYYEAAGGDATELLGHSARSITKKHYLDPRITKATKPACELIPAIINGVTEDRGKVVRISEKGGAYHA